MYKAMALKLAALMDINAFTDDEVATGGINNGQSTDSRLLLLLYDTMQT